MTVTASAGKPKGRRAGNSAGAVDVSGGGASQSTGTIDIGIESAGAERNHAGGHWEQVGTCSHPLRLLLSTTLFPLNKSRRAMVGNMFLPVPSTLFGRNSLINSDSLAVFGL